MTSCWFWTNRQYVGIECVVCYLLYDALWHGHNCTLACYWNTIQWQWWHTALRWCCLHVCMERRFVGFGRIVRTLVWVDIWIWMCHCLVYDAPWNHRNWTRDYNDNDIRRWYWCHVGCGRTASTLVLVHVLTFKSVNVMYTMHHEAITSTQPPPFEYNCNDTRLGTDGDVDWTCGTVSYWLWTNRKYVGIGACFNWNVSLPCIRWTTTPSQLHARLLFNGNVTWLCADVDIDWMYERYRIGFQRTGSTLALVYVWTWMCPYLVYDAPWQHRNCTVVYYLHTIVMAYGSALMLIKYMKRYCVGFGRTECTLVLEHV